ncbi:phosphomevalonate kinase, peroxisomal-like isoform X2 [Rhododendron vialii]|uniref:phosphomevalonate kinase, peroxisomal-like isoform X2 n=1 Tax=Rhododendron vialii TaxID=182163 RepID=UPI0026604947|nr:phosphomevalonate kinase, peroxisomal-like isoform X2 [Rhododendron vialii]XP_058191070.1 phosphomevalonate kinase, peroxisomal-like isoform X2 [Rhododendron vialii]XP_058191071.1 phosphomevalonate kinase, peroxisomal-like isoform X2 [Rhododendron vialii]
MAIVASAPGKVLMTGGYLVLERPNAGVVLSTNARFYAIVKPLYEELKPDSWAWGWTDVKLTSPQMSRETSYKMSLKHLTLQCVSSSESRNPFVEYAVQYSVAAADATFDKSKKDWLHKCLLQGLDVTILGCNDFYSYRNQIEARGLPLTPESLASLPQFTSISFNIEDANGGNRKPEVAKTGLGSSAAMTTAVVAALLQYFGVVNLPSLSKDQYQEMETTMDLDVVHVIAQTAHCIAQGKVGSGFDVSSAVYGSQRYVRFSPEVLSSAQDAVHGKELEEVIGDVMNGKWDHQRSKFSLPPLMNLLLGEPGTGGSSTVSMVGAVKKWQKSQPQNALEMWRKLSEANSALEMHLNSLSTVAKEHWDLYKSIIFNCSMHRSEKWMEQTSNPREEEVVKALFGARDAMLEIRHLMRLMGEAAGIPIEPESQTQLLDATMNMEGVLLAGVPGAGGFDAVFAVTLGNSSSEVSKAWSSLNVLALLVREDPRGVSLESSDPQTKEVTSAISSVQIK